MARFATLCALIVVLAGGARSASADALVGTVSLEWTAPGDDSLRGQASIYDIRYSRQPITESNYANTRRAMMKRAGEPGERERCTVTNLRAGVEYFFAVKTQDRDGNWSGLSNLATYRGRAVGPEPKGPGSNAGSEVTVIDFATPWPNPARESTQLRLDLPHPAWARVEVFDAAGRRVITLVASFQPAGRNRVDWNLRDVRGNPVDAGVYLVRAEVDGSSFLRRVVVVH